MDQPKRRTRPGVGFVLLVFALVAGLALGATAALPVGHSAGVRAPAVSAHAAPLARTVPAAPSPVVATAAILSTFATYTILPAPLSFMATVTNSSIEPGFAGVWLNITDFTTSKLCVSNDLSSAVYPVTATLVNASNPAVGTISTAYWSLDLTSDMVVNTTACPNFALDPAIMSVAVSFTDPTNGTGGAASTVQTSFIFMPVTSQLNIVTTASAPSTFTFSATYSAQYVGRVALSVYNPTTHLVTFTASLAHGSTNWTQTIPGAYPYTLSVYTAFGVFNSTGVINVIPPGSTFYNSTTWVNSTLISGLSSSAAGTLLLIVGLLIGMIVAMVVGRMVWGGPRAVPPAQPWAQKPAAANTCNVCGQSFATPEELAAHSKSEHGMQ